MSRIKLANIAALDVGARLHLEWRSGLVVEWTVFRVIWVDGRLLTTRRDLSERLFAVIGLDLAVRGHLAVAARNLVIPSHLEIVVLISWKWSIAVLRWRRGKNRRHGFGRILSSQIIVLGAQVPHHLHQGVHLSVKQGNRLVAGADRRAVDSKVLGTCVSSDSGCFGCLTFRFGLGDLPAGCYWSSWMMSLIDFGSQFDSSLVTWRESGA